MLHVMQQARKATTAAPTVILFVLSSQRDDLKDAKNWEEVVDGCGGSYADLAVVVTKHLSQAAATPKSEMAVEALTSVVMLLQPLHEVYDDFTSTLLSHGIIAALVSALAIDGSAPPVAGLPHRPVDLCMAMIVEYIQVSPGYTWIAEALQAGLLRHIVSFMEKTIEASYTRGMYSDLKKLLCTVLPSGLVSYAVVTQIKKSFSEIQEASQSQKFARSVLFEDWRVFKTLVEQRVRVLDAWESSGRASFLACDNLKCGKISKKDQFKSCSRCRSASYCSSECQRLDWLDAHRDVCDKLRPALLQYHPTRIPPRERAFMRALLHADYTRLRSNLLHRLVTCIHQRPNQPFYVSFDYTKGPRDVQIEVFPKPDEARSSDDYVTAQWGRLGRAGGRMTLHVMRISLGRLVYQLVFPLRAPSARLHDGIRRIAGGVAALQPAQVEAVLHALMQSADKDGAEIH